MTPHHRFHPTRALLAILLVGGGLARAEHRVALLIDNSANRNESLATPRRDMAALADVLGKRGFRCRVERDLGDDDLRSTIEAFANTTPTRGTALVFLSGPVAKGSYRNEAGVCLLGTNSNADRGYLLRLALEALVIRGGSTRNLLVVDGPEPPAFDEDVPDDGLIAYADDAALVRSLAGSGDIVAALAEQSAWEKSTLAKGVEITGNGSVAIAPPGELVEGARAGDEWVNPRGMVFCWCPAGSYMAGSPETEPGRFADEKPHAVTIERGFWIAKYETTENQWTANNKGRGLAEGRNLPANTFSQSKDCFRFLKPLREESKLPDGWDYALPTENEWEYAARAGTTTAYHFGDDPTELKQYGNFGDRSYYESGDVFATSAHREWDDGFEKLAPVGSYRPNAWGLHDVHGNVAEWTEEVTSRGGSWASTVESCRSAHRQRLGDRDQKPYVGARFVIRRAP